LYDELAHIAAPDSAASYQHHAVHAAMKILINSAYGYMDAGSMTLFADQYAADKVTRRRARDSWPGQDGCQALFIMAVLPG